MKLEDTNRLKNLRIIIAWYGLGLIVIAAIAYLRFFLGGSHRCGVTQLALMLTGALIVMISWRISQNIQTILIRRIAALLFFLTAWFDWLLYGQQGTVGYLIAFIVAGTIVWLLPYQFFPVEKVIILGLSTVVTVLIVAIPLELLLRSEQSQYHLFGVYGPLPSRLQPVLLNSQGYRDIDHTIEKPPGVTRILILGDSFTYGYNVADNESYPRLLTQMAGPNVEFIVLAKPGWSTFDELTVLRQQGLAYQPDIVMVGVFTNDPEPAPDLEYLLLLSEWKVFTCAPVNLRILDFLDYQINRLSDQWGLRSGYTAWENDLYDPNKPYWAGWQKTVRELGLLLHSKNIPAYAFLLPSPINPQAEPVKRKYEALAQEFTEADFQTVNLWPVYAQEFADASFKELWALPNDAHPGPELHAFYARQMWDILKPEIERKK